MKNAKPIGKGDNIEHRNGFARGYVPRILCGVDVCSRLVDHFRVDHGGEQGSYEGSSHGGIQSLKSSKGWTGTLYPKVPLSRLPASLDFPLQLNKRLTINACENSW